MDDGNRGVIRQLPELLGRSSGAELSEGFLELLRLLSELAGARCDFLHAGGLLLRGG